MNESQTKLYRRAYLLSIVTIGYNLIEGVVATILGFEDETLALFGFGIDSFIEVMSGIGIAVMITRIRANPNSSKTEFEIRALRVTGTAFYILAVSLLAGVVLSIATGHTPETTFWGVVISSLSIATMLWLMTAKKRTGRKLNSEPIVADANCTRVCLYMSVVLLASSLIYELTGFAYADVIGAAALAWFSFTEGRESFEKAKGKSCCC
jgi:divalent metal cation (Fe/Co/Zn/Cd) transporter